MHRLLSCLALVCALAAPSSIRAAPCTSAVADADRVAGIESSARFRFIQRTLDREARYARFWNHGWGWGLLAATAGQAGIAQLIDDRANRDVLYVSVAKSALGTISTFFMTPVRVERVTASGPEPNCTDLERAEAALLAAAKSERVTWLRHVEGLAVNLAGALYLGIAHDAWGRALGGALVGLCVGEFRLWSRPSGAIRALRRYRAGDIPGTGDLADAEGVAWTVVPILGAEGTYGLSLGISF